MNLMHIHEMAELFLKLGVASNEVSIVKFLNSNTGKGVIHRTKQLPRSCRGILETYDTIAIGYRFGIWDHYIKTTSKMWSHRVPKHVYLTTFKPKSSRI